MSRLLTVVFVCAMLCVAGAAWAQTSTDEDQTPETPSFNLKPTGGSRDEVEDVDSASEYEPIIAEKSVETTLTLGFWDLGVTLLEHDAMIYRYADDFTYIGDVVLKGESAFNPQLRVSYNFNPWFSVEPFFDISVSEYQSTITNPQQVSNTDEDAELEAVDALGEFDNERRSNITLGTGVNALFFPWDYGNFGKGRWHPYVIGGVSRVWMDINSDYVDDRAAMWRYGAGAGFRLIADEMVSLRFEMMYNRFSFQFTPAETFFEKNEGQLRVPVSAYVAGENPPLVDVAEFEKQSASTLTWSLGFIATF